MKDVNLNHIIIFSSRIQVNVDLDHRYPALSDWMEDQSPHTHVFT